MGSKRSLIVVLYLLLHGCFLQDLPAKECDWTQQPCMYGDAPAVRATGKTIVQDVIMEAAKLPIIFDGFKNFGDGLEKINNIFKDKEVGKTLTNILKVMDSLSKFASCFGFLDSVFGLVMNFIPQTDPNLEYMIEQFTEINMKLDSMSRQIDSLKNEIEWDTYASTYGKDENVIKNSWDELMKFLKEAPSVDEQNKLSLAKAFTTYYTNSATRNSVSNFYRFLTENEAASLNKNLLQLIIQKSKGDIKIVSMYSGYFLSLMVKGLQMNVYYNIMKGYGSVSGAKEGVEKLTIMLTAMKNALIQCADESLSWALDDANTIATEYFSNNLELANAIRTKLDQKYTWYEWTVIVHDIGDENERTFGYSKDLLAQNKAKIHLIHREKNFIVNEGIQEEIENKLGHSMCSKMKNNNLDSPFTDNVLKHIEYIHVVSKSSSYAQTSTTGLVEYECQEKKVVAHISIWVKMFDLTVFLKSRNVVEQGPCLKNNCHNNGMCKQIKDTTEEFCICPRMFTGPTCKQSVQHLIDFAFIESELNGIALKPVPDMTGIYHSIKELQDYTRIQVQNIRNDLDWAKIFIKYNNIIESFRYIKHRHIDLKAGKITKDQFITEVGKKIEKENTFLYMLSQFNKMMQGKGFMEVKSILDIVRETLIDNDENNPKECSAAYSDTLDYFVHYIFAVEKEAVSAWSKYLVITDQKEDVDAVTTKFESYVSEQWTKFNKNGCGPLQAEKLSNTYCTKPYHSNEQQVRLKCADGYKPFPKTVTCSDGQWSHLPFCHTDLTEKLTMEYKTEGGAAVCIASCIEGWTFQNGTSIVNYTCIEQPCNALILPSCDRCKFDSSCQDSEVCRNGKCISVCDAYPCGDNTDCTGRNHTSQCACKSPWKGDPTQAQGCHEQDVIWERSLEIPTNAVRNSTAGIVVCMARGRDGLDHGGCFYEHDGKKHCHYEYDSTEQSVMDFKILVDPCGGKGVEWVTGVPNPKSVKIGNSAQMYVCCGPRGITGKLILTQIGWECHIGFGGGTWVAVDFKILQQKPCF
ncbi:hypothetical protein UPYG_G00240110 [Umbra pygmaea]|uniref:Uncharacterized protein n=1 Tax=Umbra pygmaea TaxID=75934 RepID=A0ABD0WF59_UMBPY